MKLVWSPPVSGDRTSLHLPAPQQKLLERVHSTGKPTTLLMNQD